MFVCFPGLELQNVDTSRTSTSTSAMTSAISGMGVGWFFHLDGGGYCHFFPCVVIASCEEVSQVLCFFLFCNNENTSFRVICTYIYVRTHGLRYIYIYIITGTYISSVRSEVGPKSLDQIVWIKIVWAERIGCRTSLARAGRIGTDDIILRRVVEQESNR